MIFTARQLEELHRTNGHVTLPYRARLSPLAQSRPDTPVTPHTASFVDFDLLARTDPVT